MGKYRAYSEYKDSGVEWLGVVPSHWRLEKAKFLFDRKQRPVREEDGVVTAFRDGEVTLRSKRREAGFTNSLKEIGYQGVRVGDLLIHAMDGFAGAIGVSDSDGKCSPVCSVCVPAGRYGVSSRYYGRLLRHMALTGFVTALAKGIRERSTEFRFNEFKELALALPPEDEQTQIAAFLDRETAKIDRLIAKQEALIELLKEKRQAVISHAVTKGLDPDAPMKDSGVEWLGEIPAHWGVARLGYYSQVANGSTPSKANPDYWTDGDVPWVSSGDLNQYQIDQPSGSITRKALAECSVELVPAGAVLVGMVGQGKTRGLSAVLKVPSTINQNVASIVCDQRLNPTFLHFVLQSVYKSLREYGRGGNQAALNCEIVSSIRFPLPSIDEQKEITTFLERQLIRVDEIVERSKKQVLLLQERRTALISAAVTGKIDVREEVL